MMLLLEMAELAEHMRLVARNMEASGIRGTKEHAKELNGAAMMLEQWRYDITDEAKK